MASLGTEGGMRLPSASAESFFSMTGRGGVGGPPEGTNMSSSVLASADGRHFCSSSSSGSAFGGSMTTRSRPFVDKGIMEVPQEGPGGSHVNTLESFEAHAGTNEGYLHIVAEWTARNDAAGGLEKGGEEEDEEEGEEGEEEDEEEEEEEDDEEDGNKVATTVDTRLAVSSALNKVPPQLPELLEAIEKVKSQGIFFDGTNRLCSFILEHMHMLGDAVDLASDMRSYKATPKYRADRDSGRCVLFFYRSTRRRMRKDDTQWVHGTPVLTVLAPKTLSSKSREKRSLHFGGREHRVTDCVVLQHGSDDLMGFKARRYQLIEKKGTTKSFSRGVTPSPLTSSHPLVLAAGAAEENDFRPLNVQESTTLDAIVSVLMKHSPEEKRMILQMAWGKLCSEEDSGNGQGQR